MDGEVVIVYTHAILSGCPSPTDSEVKRKVSPLWFPLVMPFMFAEL